VNLQDFESHLVWAEGERLDLYKDSVGIYTIGVGHNIQEKGVSKAVSRLMLKEDVQDVVKDTRTLDYWDDLDSVRQLVVADMVFNLGLSRFLRFKRFNAALRQPDYSLAAHEMKDSKWYQQVGRRAHKLEKAMLTGEWNG
jgi:lysozyme